MTTARPLKLYVMVLQKFLCAPEQRSGALLGLGGLLQSLQGNESQGGKAKALNLSCGGAEFDLCLWEWKGLQSTTVQGDGCVPLLWKTAGSCLK